MNHFAASILKNSFGKSNVQTLEIVMTVHASKHPLVAHKISLLRDNDISVKKFRELTAEIASVLTMEATHDLKLSETAINCWSGQITGSTLADKQPTFVPILRAGLGMLDGGLAMLPGAKISVVGIARNEQTLEAESYYQNIVSDIADRTALVIDPMLATGGSAIATIDLLKASGCKRIKALFMVAAPEGVEKLTQLHPDVDLHIAAVDEKLNEHGYILPGLGDAGDKIFGTL